ncbi:aldose epimerase family protein [Daejeonia sp. YH14]|uniref:aldose epimerase family protein n=1 Tax=Daejeonia sp. YH14 TaxID=3439042 RepID=UPI003F4919EB
MKKQGFTIAFALLAALLTFSCKKNEVRPGNSSENMKNIQISDYGVTSKGDSIRKYTLTNKNGMKVEIINYGGIVTSLTAPDKNGKYEDVVLGYTKPEDYFNGNPYYFGALIGRYGNRIANAQFILDGKTYDIDRNDGPNSLHGGKEGFFARIWKAEPIENGANPALKLTYVSADGEEGYPGTLSVAVTYTLTNEDALEISYEAETDKTTVLNLTNHSYFNLSGKFDQPVTDHELLLNADRFLPVNATLIPTGVLASVKGTPFDFTTSKLIGKDISTANEQLKIANGYDHCWVLNGNGMKTFAKVYHPATGRLMEVSTDQPGVQFYSGNFLDGKYDTKTGGKNNFRTGLCLETQHFPDAPNQPSFPSAVLKPGEKYHTTTIYRFTVKK